MKIFDFTNGTKGELLGEARRSQAFSGFLASKGGEGDPVFKITLASAPRNWQWMQGACRFWNDEREDLKPEDFGVEAICFSTGKDSSGVWDWYVVGTDAWNREACKSGILNMERKGVIRDGYYDLDD